MQIMTFITRQQAELVYGVKLSDRQFQDLSECLMKYEINNLDRIHHFMSQTAHQSNSLSCLEQVDNGDYLEGRKDIGNIRPGDGHKYKGAGAIQLIGRANYQAFSDAISDIKVMDGYAYVAARYPFTAAGFWWWNNNMNDLCDEHPSVKKVTTRVDGGHGGLDSRIMYYEKACQVITELIK